MGEQLKEVFTGKVVNKRLDSSTPGWTSSRVMSWST